LPVSIGRPDEIGQLKMAFNAMIDELTRSKRREKEEEELRQRLIGSLSHDLRTPLTVIGSHLYSLEREPLSGEGRRSIQLMQMKISDLDRLLDHLLSYNLLLNGKYALSPQRMDVLRLVRQSAAAWYPLWESAGLEAELSLPETPIVWEVDEQGFYRVLDNLFQNVVRHAGGGDFIGISVEERYGLAALVIADRGNGMESTGSTKGAGLGLSVVDLLLKEMKLLREAESSSAGTRVYIVPIPI
jgi:signal transduction histidine kinase